MQKYLVQRVHSCHVYIHEWLYNLTATGLNIRFAQQIYGLIYLASQTLSAATYIQAGNIPNYALLLLPLSKRLHSIYVLRLFNDCWAVVGAQAAILALSRGWDSMACILFSVAISVKMSVLLYIPGLFIILLRRRGFIQAALYGLLIVLFQAILGKPFLVEYPLQYLAGSFDLSRVFLFKWTVNWRFLGEDIFLDPALAKGLLLGHLCALVAFAHVKWCHSDGGLFGLLCTSLRNPFKGSLKPLTSDYIVTVLMTSNLIGIVFARSLHYQFYSWYAQQIPFLAWRTRFPLPIKLVLIFGIEFAWNVFPSTSFSSALLVGANVVLLAGIWLGWPNGCVSTTTQK